MGGGESVAVVLCAIDTAAVVDEIRAAFCFHVAARDSRQQARACFRYRYRRGMT